MSSPFGNPQPADPFSPGGFADQSTAAFDRPAGDFTTNSTKPLTPITGSWPFVIVAFCCALLAVVCALCAVTIGGSATDTLYRYFAIAGWVLGGIFSLIALGLHFAANNRRQAESFYIENATQTLLARATLVLGSIAVVATAAEIALWLSKTIGN